jgi:DNA polymerase
MSGKRTPDDPDVEGVVEVPVTKDLRVLQRASADCVRCDLHLLGTQTVFGEGRRGAWLMLVGEQPGDREDIEGRPFVGPAGAVLDRALDEVGIARDEVYVTNAVKHFRWEPRGKRRIHKTPSTEHVKACRPWLLAEIKAVDPSALVVLGAVALKAVLGPSFRVTACRGQVLDSSFDIPALVTIHPSAILRSDDRDAAYAGFVSDLRAVYPLRPSGTTSA